MRPRAAAKAAGGAADAEQGLSTAGRRARHRPRAARRRRARGRRARHLVTPARRPRAGGPPATARGRARRGGGQVGIADAALVDVRSTAGVAGGEAQRERSPAGPVSAAAGRRVPGGARGAGQEHRAPGWRRGEQRGVGESGQRTSPARSRRGALLGHTKGRGRARRPHLAGRVARLEWARASALAEGPEGAAPAAPRARRRRAAPRTRAPAPRSTAARLPARRARPPPGRRRPPMISTGRARVGSDDRRHRTSPARPIPSARRRWPALRRACSALAPPPACGSVEQEGQALPGVLTGGQPQLRATICPQSDEQACAQQARAEGVRRETSAR